MLVDVYSKEGQVVGQIEVRDDIFAIEPHEHAMHMAVVAYLANQRQGTHKTKVRSEVRGGGKKPWRQKGRGTARAGS
ncbi:MAG: 50S ribosomal protein L4, partial [Candidatus Kapaibacteriota bacterium]